MIKPLALAMLALISNSVAAADTPATLMAHFAQHAGSSVSALSAARGETLYRSEHPGRADHFGENASLDPASQTDILRFLEANAADAGTSQIGRRVMQRMGAKDVPMRITETRWFVGKHDEVPRAAWLRKSVGSAANCAACHSKAEQGRFDDDAVRIPK